MFGSAETGRDILWFAFLSRALRWTSEDTATLTLSFERRGFQRANVIEPYSIGGHDENASGSRLVARIPSKHTALAAFHLQLVLLPLGSNRRILRTVQTSFFQARPDRLISAVKLSFPILMKLIASSAIVGIHFKMEWGSAIFPTCTS